MVYNLYVKYVKYVFGHSEVFPSYVMIVQGERCSYWSYNGSSNGKKLMKIGTVSLTGSFTLPPGSTFAFAM